MLSTPHGARRSYDGVGRGALPGLYMKPIITKLFEVGTIGRESIMYEYLRNMVQVIHYADVRRSTWKIDVMLGGTVEAPWKIQQKSRGKDSSTGASGTSQSNKTAAPSLRRSFLPCKRFLLLICP